MLISVSTVSTARNDLGALLRKPSDLARYLTWSTETKAQYGSIMNFVCQRRLGWDLPGDPGDSGDPDDPKKKPQKASYNNPVPFADPADYKILRNDWPYGFVPGITHLVVWLRTPLPTQGDGGDLTEGARALIEEFVDRTFVARLAREATDGQDRDPRAQVLWFKNWGALQSVRALEHVHILVRDVPESILREWTASDTV